MTSEIAVADPLDAELTLVRRPQQRYRRRSWRQIDPGKVFDLTLPLEEAPERYQAMDERPAIKTLLLVEL